MNKFQLQMLITKKVFLFVLQRVSIVFKRLKIYSLNRKIHTENCKASNVRLLATSIRIVWTKPRETGREKDSGEEGLGKEWILWRPAGGGERERVRGEG